MKIKLPNPKLEPGEKVYYNKALVEANVKVVSNYGLWIEYFNDKKRENKKFVILNRHQIYGGEKNTYYRYDIKVDGEKKNQEVFYIPSFYFITVRDTFNLFMKDILKEER
jgi:hypothetical protein